MAECQVANSGLTLLVCREKILSIAHNSFFNRSICRRTNRPTRLFTKKTAAVVAPAAFAAA